jgi:hypothetical protein
VFFEQLVEYVSAVQKMGSLVGWLGSGRLQGKVRAELDVE